MKSLEDNGIKPSVELDKILDRLVSSVVGLKLSNAKDYKEFVPTAKQAIELLIAEAEKLGYAKGLLKGRADMRTTLQVNPKSHNYTEESEVKETI